MTKEEIQKAVEESILETKTIGCLPYSKLIVSAVTKKLFPKPKKELNWGPNDSLKYAFAWEPTSKYVYYKFGTGWNKVSYHTLVLDMNTGSVIEFKSFQTEDERNTYIEEKENE